MIRVLVAFLIGSMAMLTAQNTATITGNVINGTTGKKIKADWVVLVKSGQGLTTVQQLDNVSEYNFAGVEPNPSAPYLVRASYQGVVYTTNVMVTGAVTLNEDVKVYESSSKWGNISVRVPHLIVVREGNVLQIEETFEISNLGTTTFNQKDSKVPTFRFNAPIGAQIINVSTSVNRSMPISQNYFEFEDGYGVNLPLRPGMTQIQVAYTLDYQRGSAELTHQWYYDVTECNAFLLPVDLQITADGFTKIDDKQMEDNGFIIYAAKTIKAGTALKMQLAGGSVVDRHQDSKIEAKGNALQEAVWVILPMMLAVLLFGLYWGISKKTTQPVYHEKKGSNRDLKRQKEQLIQTLARLDDDFERSGTDKKTYEKKRIELKSQLHDVLTLINQH
ncbi:hypothetical protein HUU42_07110 [bacterium]|nr:hypothetical protein [bacterium]